MLVQIAYFFVLICNCLDLELKGEARMKQITAEWKKKEIGRKLAITSCSNMLTRPDLACYRYNLDLKRVLGIKLESKHAGSCYTVQLLCKYWSGNMAALFFCD